jgi:8-oxo-dGTP pyrophosphatase MutT (NUDIX family)
MVAVTTPIHRVVTCFILSSSSRIATFHRCATMPSFPNHFAGISGTIEPNETPHQAAQRELFEETNLTETVEEQGGLFVNVPYTSPRTQQKRIIRVYPFVIHVSDNVPLEMRGTEHDAFKFVTIEELTEIESQCVPGLVKAFHHATYGKFNHNIPDQVRHWADDKETGASVMTQKALELVQASGDKDAASIATQIAMLRPSMVPIVNVMNHIVVKGKDSVTMESFLDEIQRCVELGRKTIRTLQTKKGTPLKIATFSRSGTLAKILQPFSASCEIICAQSTPADEGELMAIDLKTRWIPDIQMQKVLTQKGGVDVFLVGSDCMLPTQMVNKVGTRKLCEIARSNHVPV